MATVRSTCHSQHPQIRTGEFLLEENFTASVPLLTATSKFGLVRTRTVSQSSRQQCYLYCLRTTVSNLTQQTEIIFIISIWVWHAYTEFWVYGMHKFWQICIKSADGKAGFPLFWKKKIPGVFQSNFRIFQVLSVIVRNRISNAFGPQ